MALPVGWVWGQMSYRDELLKFTLLTLMWTAILGGVAGVIVGFVGRVFCLRMPEEFPAIRGRARAAVVLEATGWLSLFVGVGLIFSLSELRMYEFMWVPAVGMGFSGLMMFCGRVLFLLFLSKLAAAVEDKPSVRRARWSFALFLTDWGVGLFGLGLSAAGSMLRVYELTSPLVAILWVMAGASGVGGLILYDRLLSGLARTVQKLANEEEEEEETATEREDN